MNSWPYILVGLVVAERTAELLYSLRNTRALKQRGGVEVNGRAFGLIFVLHLAWLTAIVTALPAHAAVNWAWVAVLALLQPPRLWVIASLGRYWTTRIIVTPGAPLIRHGPYRFLHHPAYLLAAVEIAALPLAFGETGVAVVFFVLNAMVMTWRARQEDAALAPLRSLPESPEPVAFRSN
jgi:methyltransferase